MTEEAIKKKIELEVEVTPNNVGANPYHKWIHLAKTVDAWRIFPRIFVSVYIVSVSYTHLTLPTIYSV